MSRSAWELACAPNTRDALTVLALAGWIGGCAVGPSYRPSPAVSPATRVGGGRPTPAAGAFFDSLAAARAAESGPAPLFTTPLLSLDAAGPPGEELRLFAILRDTVLTGLVETALQQNRDLVAARARIREFRAEVGTARAPLFPNLTLNASGSRNQVAFAGFPSTLFTALTITSDLGWELDFWGGTRRGLQAANAERDGEGAAERGRVLEVVSEVATAYLQLLALDQDYAIAEQTLASRQVTLDLARRRLARGLTSALDVYQFEAQLAIPAVALAELQRLQALQESALSELIGVAPTRIPRGGTLRQAASAVVVPDSLAAERLARRPDVQRAERAFAAATARVGVADAARLPAGSIFSSYGTQASDTDQLFDSSARIWSAQVGLSFRVFTGGDLENRSRAARARAEQARAAYEQSVLSALREASDALTNVRAARDLMAAEQTRVAALQRAFHLAALRYESGLSSYLEVLEAQRSLFDAELALTDAELRQLLAAVQLYKALGGSWEP